MAGERQGVWITRERRDRGDESASFPKEGLFYPGLLWTRAPIHNSTSREATAGTPFKHPSTHPAHPSITCVLCPVLCPASHDFILSTSPQSPSQKDELLSRFLTVLALSVAQTAISDAMEASPAVLDRCKPSDYVRR